MLSVVYIASLSLSAWLGIFMKCFYHYLISLVAGYLVSLLAGWCSQSFIVSKTKILFSHLQNLICMYERSMRYIYDVPLYICTYIQAFGFVQAACIIIFCINFLATNKSTNKQMLQIHSLALGLEFIGQFVDSFIESFVYFFFFIKKY